MENMTQINDCGILLLLTILKFITGTNWRKNGGSSRMIEISKREEFYQQEYCGCVYSLRDTIAGV